MSAEFTSHKLSRRRFLGMTAGAAGALALAGCVAPAAAPAAPAAEGSEAGAAAPAQAPVTVLWWRSQGGATGDLLDRFAADYTAATENVTIQAEFQGSYIEHLDKLIASAAAGVLPDMIHIGDGQYPPLARNGILQSLTPLVEGPNGLDLGTYGTPVNRGILEDGEMYQLAYGVSTPIYYYNVEALDAAGLSGAPETWEQAFNDYFPKLTTPDMVSFAYHLDNWWQQNAVWSAGAMVNDENWEVDLANPAVVEWFERMQKARQDGYVYVPTEADGGAVAYFAGGKAAMMVQSTGVIGQVDEVNAGKFTADVGFLPGGVGGRWVPSGGNGLSIVANIDEAKRDAAWEFIKYLESPQPFTEYVQITGYIPLTDGVREAMADDLAADPRRQVAIDQFEFSRWHMKVHTLARAAQEMKTAWDEIVLTDVNVAERLQRLQDTVVEVAREEGFEPTLPQ